MSDLAVITFEPEPAYQLVESPLANVCDTNYTSIAKMAKRYLAGTRLWVTPTSACAGWPLTTSGKAQRSLSRFAI